MAKFRMNHQRSGRGGSSMIAKIGVLSFLLFATVFGFLQFSSSELPWWMPEPTKAEERFFLPSTNGKQTVIHRPYYSLALKENGASPCWAAYELRADRFGKPAKGQAAGEGDWVQAPLALPGDLGFARLSKKDTEIPENQVWQRTGNFQRMWSVLARQLRRWSIEEGMLYQTSGPWWKQNTGAVRPDRPDGYFRVAVDLNGPDFRGIGFLLENEGPIESLGNRVVSIDSIENLTGIDFFAELMLDSLEALIEGEYCPEDWTWSEQ